MLPRLLLGEVAYDPKVVTIWAGSAPGCAGTLDFDYVLYLELLAPR